MFDISSFAQGLALGLGMFVCPGPKDLLILRRTLSRHPALELVAIGVLSDALLIGLGMAGVSALLGRAPALQKAALWLGIALMLVHGALAAYRAVTGTGGIASPTPGAPPPSRSKDLAAVLAVSLLNPVAWLDTVLVIGTAGAALPALMQPGFAAGATTASLAWFCALVAGGRVAGRWMTAPGTWRMLDAFVALTMVGLAAYLAHGSG